PSFGHPASNPVSVETPLRSGPNHCGQSAAKEKEPQMNTDKHRIKDGRMIAPPAFLPSPLWGRGDGGEGAVTPPLPPPPSPPRARGESRLSPPVLFPRQTPRAPGASPFPAPPRAPRT